MITQQIAKQKVQMKSAEETKLSNVSMKQPTAIRTRNLSIKTRKSNILKIIKRFFVVLTSTFLPRLLKTSALPSPKNGTIVILELSPLVQTSSKYLLASKHLAAKNPFKSHKRTLSPPLFNFYFKLIFLFFLSMLSSEALRQPTFTYHNHGWLGRYLREVQRQHASITHLYSIGTSVRGKRLWVMAIGKSPKVHVKLRPEVKFIGNIHGNEVVTRELMIQLIYYLTSNYKRKKTISNLLNTTRMHILVSMNPDGYYLAETNGAGSCLGVVGRNNYNNQDLNRNFPDFFSKSPHKRHQPETKAVMGWMEKHQFLLSASFHGGALVVNYPYDNLPPGIKGPRYSMSRDDDVFRHLASTYSSNHRTMYRGIKCPGDKAGFVNGIVNGASWYLVKGSMQDFNYIYAGCMELTIEVTCCKYPQEWSLKKEWVNNKKALIKLHSKANSGVKGLVLDWDERPIKGALVHIIGRDHPTKTTQLGEFWRILLPGKFQIKIEVFGHQPILHSFNLPPTQEDFQSDFYPELQRDKSFVVGTYYDDASVTVLKFQLKKKNMRNGALSFPIKLLCILVISLFQLC